LSLACAKLELLRLALDLRLAELPANSSINKRDSVLHQEMETASVSAQPRIFQKLTKMAALSGQLNVRLFGLYLSLQGCIIHGADGAAAPGTQLG